MRVTLPYPITVYSTYFTMPCTHDGYTYDDIALKPVTRNLVDFEFDRTKGRTVAKQIFSRYRKDEGIRYFPRHFLPMLIKYLNDNDAKYEIANGELIPPRTVDIPLKPGVGPRDEVQVRGLKHLVDVSNPMRLLSTGTGGGKSFMGIMSAVMLKQVPFIIVDGLQDQWRDKILEYTLLKDSDIYTLQGSKSFLTLMEQPEYYPSVFIATIDTLWTYINGTMPFIDVLPTYDQLLWKYGVGMKIVDESHLNFLMHVYIDLATRVENNIYLTATPMRSSSRQHYIFSIIYPDSLTAGKEDYTKHVDTTFYKYKLDLGVSEKRLGTQKGYMHAKYETQLMSNRKAYDFWLQDVLIPVLYKEYLSVKEKGDQCVIFVRTKIFADQLAASLQKLLKDEVVDTYITGNKSEDILTKTDIIISTHLSLGTGNDIANLTTTGNTESFQSDVQTIQQLGRTRKKEGRVCRRFDLANVHYDSHRRHMYKRAQVYKKRSKSYQEVNL